MLCQRTRDDPITLIRRAEAQALQGLYSEALEDTSKALALSPKQWKSHHHKAEVLKALGRTEESLASFVACLVLREDVMLRQHVVVILDQYLSTDAENSVSDGSFQKLHRVFYLCSKELNPNSVLPSGSFQGSLALEDFDCVLCGRLLYKPVTTPCGHVFCRSCLNRSLDHRPSCPTCRGALSEYLASVLGRSECVTEAIERMIQQFFSDDYRTRDQLYRQELRQLAGPPLGHLPVEADIPVLVCGAAFPSVSCPLHIYEPCYRLMLRRCLESNSYQFGMCQPSEQSQLAPVGTMLRVRGVQFIADGRSMVDAVGGKRFKVLKYGMLDGYGRAVVRFFSDEKVQSGPELIALCTKVHEATKNWFTSLSTVIKDRITGCFGPLPQYNPTSDPQSKDDGPDWVWWACAALQGQFQAANVLALTSLKDRLQMLQHFVDEQANVMELCRPQ
ncbi:LON peptidase N-terminal domain and RING finger protein 2-like isoform X2 [Corticium candelabrum]|uniref:LON peptidase N-terminal domain and RING finger protein 2-like isoform X2 n=1 Tax=Corticium candelabrum TaxID=121492 RepID=UPI002E26D893|nr:LON peptidase N-terminal domain and RING finger protein 2-like isoform X2 [Corticium candelabrum]